MNIRQKLQTAICLTVIAFACMTVPTAAKAQIVLSTAVCAGEGNATYSPAITKTPQNTDLHVGGFFSCPVTTSPGLVGGSFTIDGKGSLSCLGASTFSGQLTLNWTDPTSGSTVATSVVPLSSLGLQVPVGSVIVAAGNIASGAFQGAGTTSVFQLTTIQLLGCLNGPGFENASGPFILNVGLAL